MTLIELLIAMVVMSIGIAALVAGFSSGILSLVHHRARLTSTAGSLADKQMELYRQASFTSLPTTLQTATTPTGPDGHTYWMQVDGVVDLRRRHVFRGAASPAAPARPQAVRSSSVTINVRDGSATARLLFTETTTFDSSTS